MIEWESLRQGFVEGGLLHLGFLTVAGAYLLRDVLHLRVLAIAGYALFIADSIRADMPNPALLGWYGLFLLVNGVHAWRLARERRRELLSAEERHLADLAFASLATAAARRLMRCGRFLDLEDGAVLLRQGVEGRSVYAIARGEIDVIVDGERVARAVPGQLVGEIGFLAGGVATASAIARGPVRALVWERAKLQKAIDRSAMLHDAVFAAFGHDLARKVAEQSLRPRTPVASARAQ